MNRRGFLVGLGSLIGGIVIDPTIPFNRVWSFPKIIKINIDNQVPRPLWTDALLTYLKSHIYQYNGHFPGLNIELRKSGNLWLPARWPHTNMIEGLDV